MSVTKERTTVLVTGFGPFKGHEVNASWETVKELSRIGFGDSIDLIIYEIPVEYDTVKKKVPEFWEKHSPDTVRYGQTVLCKIRLLLKEKSGSYRRCPAPKGEVWLLQEKSGSYRRSLAPKGEVWLLQEKCSLFAFLSASFGGITSRRNKLVVHVGVSSFASELTIEQQAHNGRYDRLDVKGCTADSCCCVEGADTIIVAGLNMKSVCDDVNCSGSKAKAEISHDAGRYLCDFSYFTSLHINRNRCAFIHVPPLDCPYNVWELAEGLKAAIQAMLKQLGL